MKIDIRFCLMALALFPGLTAQAMTQAQIDALDGNILVINQKGGPTPGSGDKIQILDADVTDWNQASAVLWEYTLVEGKDGFTCNTDGNFNDCKRVLDENGRECILLCGNGRGFALFDLLTEKFVLSNNKPTSKTHCVEILPGNNFAIGRPEFNGDDLQIYAGIKNDDSQMYDSDEHANVHDVMWDGAHQVLWSFGNGGFHRYSFDQNTRKITEVLPRPAGSPWSGQHGACPKMDEPGVFYANANGYGVVKYNHNTGTWSEIYAKSCKSVSYSPVRKEILVPIQGGTISSRSYRCDALDENGNKLRQYVMDPDNAAWYKARYFIHNTFRHPDGGPTGPANDSEFVSQSVPSSIGAGETVSVSVTMKNTGTDAWSDSTGHRLGSQNPQGNSTWGTARVVDVDVPAGSQHTFTFDITAPSTPGTYNFQWKMVDDDDPNSGWFGDATPNVSIMVVGEGLLNLANSSTHSADCGGFQTSPDKGVAYLHDGDTGSPTAKNQNQIWVEYDFGAAYTLSSAKLFGDDVGTWNSSSWTLQAWNGSGYTDVFTDSNCLGSQWFQKTFDITTSKVKVIINGQTAGTEVFELEIWGALNTGNSSPIITSTPVTSATENVPYNYTLTATDANSDPLTYNGITMPDWLSFNAGTHVLSGTPSSADIGTHSVNLSVSDGTVSVPQTFSITVSAAPVEGNLVLNHSFEEGGSAPTSWVAQSGCTAVGTTAKVQDGSSSLLLNQVSQPIKQVVTLTPGVSYNISVWIDASGLTGGKCVFDTIKYDNNGQGQYVIDSVNDANGWTQFSGSFTATNDNLTIRMFAVDTNFSGTVYFDNIVLVPSDAVNEAPVWEDDPIEKPSGQDTVPYSDSLSADVSDPDGDPLTFVKIGGASWLSVASDGTLSGTPNVVGTNTATVTVSDGVNPAVPVTIQIMVNAAPVNLPPVITSTPITTATVGEAYSYFLTATDPEGDPLTYSWQSRPTWTTFDGPSGELYGTPTETTIPIDVILRVSDGVNPVVLQEFQLTVQEVLSGYDAWAAANGAGGADEDDDGDGQKNLIDYALGGDPDVANDAEPVLTKVTDSVEYSFKQRNDDTNLTYTVEVCTDLSVGGWAGSGTTAENTGTVGVYDAVKHTIPADQSQTYIRLKVTSQ